MTSFLGCIPEQMRELNDLILERTERLRDLLDGLGARSVAVPWTGPDAESFRLRTGDAVAQGGVTVSLLTRRGQELVAQADAQDAASAPDRGASGAGGGLSTADWSGSALPGILMAPPVPQDPRSGPRPAPDDRTWAERMREDGGIGAPLAAEPGALRDTVEYLLDRAREARPEVPKEEGGLRYDPQLLSTAEGFRTIALRTLPGIGWLQGANIGHGRLEGYADDAEDWLVTHGHEEWVPALDVARAPVTVAGAFVGDESILGQSLRGIDQSMANRMQTTQNVGLELLEGDLGGAARELEYGVVRDIENTSLLLAPDPFGAVLGAGEDLTGSAADVSELVAPPAVSDRLHEVSDTIGEVREDREELRAMFTDPQEILRRRRENLPLPWDPTPARE